MKFFDWLESHSPGYTKKIFDNFDLAMQGKIRNPFQWRATENALDREFSKAAQKIEQKTENTGTVYVIKRERSESISTPQGAGSGNSESTSIQSS